MTRLVSIGLASSGFIGFVSAGLVSGGRRESEQVPGFLIGRCPIVVGVCDRWAGWDV